MPQSVKRLTSTQVMVSQFVHFESHIGLCVHSSEPEACFRICLLLSLPLLCLHSLSLSLKNKTLKKIVVMSSKLTSQFTNF